MGQPTNLIMKTKPRSEEQIGEVPNMFLPLKITKSNTSIMKESKIQVKKLATCFFYLDIETADRKTKN